MLRWILKLSFCSSNAGMKMSTPLINAIVHNGLLHSSSRIKQMPPQIIHILRFCGRLAAQDFVMKCIEVRAVQWPAVWKFYRSLTLLHFPTGGANDAQNVSVDTGRGKDNDQQNLFKKMIMWYCKVYSQIASDVWRYNNPVYRLMTNNEQTVTGVN